MSSATDDTYHQLPIAWHITHVSPTDHTCPSPSSLLGTFAVVNLIVSLLAVLFGHRRVVQELTCGFFGRRDSQSWKILWILPVGLQLAANACIAVLIQRTEGYVTNFRIEELMLWLTVRPRLSWIVLGACAFWKRVTASAHEYPHSQRQGRSSSKLNVHASYHELSPSPFAVPHLGDILQRSYIPVAVGEDNHGDFFHDYPWWSAFMTQFIAEFVLQIMALYIMGRTAHHGAARGYYKIHQSAYWDIPAAARMMYSGALYYLVAGSLFLIFAFFFIVYQMFSSKVKALGKGSTVSIVIALWFLLISTWLGSWLFWAGFVRLAGDL